MHRPLAISWVLLAAGCVPQPAVRARSTNHPLAVATVAARADASGVWDWVYRSTDDQGDMRVEQEEWHLAQNGVRIEGWYDRAVTLMSTDERLFRCNQKLGFTKVTRVRVAGKLEGDKVQLREVGFDAKPGPCDDGARNLVEYHGVITGGTLALRWGADGGQTLLKRPGESGNHSSLAQAMGENLEPETRTAAMDASIPVDGSWEWELRSIDADGDERLEREEWHLSEGPDGIHGYYDRTVKRVRGDGLYTCNSQDRFETATRYTVVGQRFGERMSLTEVDYKSQASACDNALRRLDTYQGHLADADSLVLSWGPGNQLLRRKH
jgi:hypothetical protein